MIETHETGVRRYVEVTRGGPAASVQGIVHVLRQHAALRGRPGILAALHAMPSLAYGGHAAPDRDASPDIVIGLLAQLRAVTTGQVYALRQQGLPPERVLVDVKVALRNALVMERWYDPSVAEALTRLMIGWSIAAYYDR